MDVNPPSPYLCRGFWMAHATSDYVAAYTQAPIDRNMYMEFPRGFTVPGGVDRKAFVLKLHRNLYGQKQAGRVWYKYLRK